MIKLSELMRYMLYESDEKKVPLSKEIEYLESYIDLQKLRFGEDVTIELINQIPKEELQTNIEPMLLVPFVENAFKHGMGVDKPIIQICAGVQNKKLEFDVKNKFMADENESKDAGSGIGLENVESRLSLLYPKEYKLVVSKENNLFHVHLTLNLK
jgi:LytS/YehU family sensor histidine kinase